MKDINLLLEEESTMSRDKSFLLKSAKSAGAMILAITIAAAAFAAMLVPLAYSGTLELKLASIREQLKSEKYRELTSAKSELSIVGQELDNKKTIISHIDAQGTPVDNILNAVRSNNPFGCEISEIQYDMKKLKLSLKAEDISVVAEFLLNMERLENLRLSDSSRMLRINNGGEYVLIFDVGLKEGE